MVPNYVQRLRITFSKIGPTRFIGHLDLARTWERALSRARIPVTYSQGFNRRPYMQMATALPLGFTSDCELVDIWLMEKMEPEVAQAQISAKMSPGIVLHKIEDVPVSGPSLQNITVESSYEVTLLDAVDVTALREKVAALLAAESVLQERRDKTYDLRPLILDLTVQEPAPGELVKLTMRLTLQPSKTGRADEVLLAMGFDPLAARIHRTLLVLSE